MKLTAIQAELTALTVTLGSTKEDVNVLKTTVKANSDILEDHSQTLHAMEVSRLGGPQQAM